MISRSGLKDILKENNIHFFSYLDKKQLIDLAKEHGVLPKEFSKPERTIDPRFDRLKDIRKNLRKVRVEDVKTGEIRDFPSIYKASKFIGSSPQTVCNWNGRVWGDKYKITIT